MSVKINILSRLGVVACSCNPATWRSGSEYGLRAGVLLSGVLCRSALCLASIWSSRGSPGGPGCLRRNVSAQGGNTAGKSSLVEQKWDSAREKALPNLSSWCLMMVERLFLAVPQGCLQFVIVVFPDHTHLFSVGSPSDRSNSILFFFFF